MPVRIDVPIIVLVGPTAIGKTSLSFSLAAEFGCEIISMDSMQVYRYMDIGTAKPTAEERQRVAHHLLDIVDPDEQYNAARFVADCLEAIKRISSQGKIPLITGGTGLYLSSLINGLFDTVHVSDKVGKRLAQMQEKMELADLYQELCRVDRATGARIHKNDRQRIIRGLEIFYSTGIPWSQHLQEQKTKGPTVLFTRMFAAGLTCAREMIYRRIEQRTAIMLAQGLVEEVESLRNMGFGPDLNSMQSIGYRHANQYIDGVWTFDDMERLLMRDTRRYAKRQMTWFRRIDSLRWYNRENKEKMINDIRLYFDKD